MRRRPGGLRRSLPDALVAANATEPANSKRDGRTSFQTNDEHVACLAFPAWRRLPRKLGRHDDELALESGAQDGDDDPASDAIGLQCGLEVGNSEEPLAAELDDQVTRRRPPWSAALSGGRPG